MWAATNGANHNAAKLPCCQSCHRCITGTNHARLSAACDGADAVVFGVIDNLVKGAAGGGLQWLNRMLGLADTAGLDGPGLGWG